MWFTRRLIDLFFETHQIAPTLRRGFLLFTAPHCVQTTYFAGHFPPAQGPS